MTEVEEATIGCVGQCAMSDGKDGLAPVQDGIAGILLVGTFQLFGAGHGNCIIALGTATATDRINQVVIVPSFEPMLSLHALPFIIP